MIGKMPYQKPKTDHPWRQYKDRAPNQDAEPPESEKKPVRLFLSEIVEAWDVVTINTYAYGKEGVFKLTELPQRKIAAWLAGVLKRHYA